MVIKSIYQDPEEGMKKKLRYEQDIGLHETFLESVPTTLVLTVIFSKVQISRTSDSDFVIGNNTMFLVTYSFSIFAASFGMAKCLKTGVARSIGPGGLLDGLLSFQFLLVVLVCGCSLVNKGFILASVGSQVQRPHVKDF